jgi:hypothetical protein
VLSGQVMRTLEIALSGTAFGAAGVCWRLAAAALSRGAPWERVRPFRVLAAVWCLGAVALAAHAAFATRTARSLGLMCFLSTLVSLWGAAEREKLERDDFLPARKHSGGERP